jgi:hypothetical protein
MSRKRCKKHHVKKLKDFFPFVDYQPVNQMASPAYKYYAPGDFSWIDDCPNYKGTDYGRRMDKEMFTDAYNSVSKVNGGWVYLRDPDAVGEGGFMFSTHVSRPDIRAEIDNELFKTESGGGHSGCSYGLTMRAMESIAKRGWLEFIRREWPDYRPPPVSTTEFGNFVTSLQNDPAARQQIPDIDVQADAMRKFEAGKMSYAEMRTLCG